MHMRHIVICGLSGSRTFFHIFLTNGMIFEKIVIEYKMCVFISSTIFVREISHSKKK